jgi:hypothetical protein
MRAAREQKPGIGTGGRGSKQTMTGEQRSSACEGEDRHRDRE